MSGKARALLDERLLDGSREPNLRKPADYSFSRAAGARPRPGGNAKTQAAKEMPRRPRGPRKRLARARAALLRSRGGARASYRGQMIVTSSITMAKTARVSIEPTLKKSKKR